ncbi:hypothetical protein [Nocardia stercoris]|uniref:Integral membrane protein n=1 Tax=Nocardia stercoris TaxID=2483361 RepID=A0A3M2LFC6_9NOCA|nr:hypothetical protein [Nocardia stercoris]RMI35776.1 hypothetical protein EBN03_02210 [Nocardia stercoris]
MVGAVQGGLGVIVAIVLVVRGAMGRDSAAGAFGTAAWFAILAGALLAAGVALLRGRRWGRAIVFIAQVLLLPVSWYMITSHQPQYGIPFGLSALAGLALLLAPPSSRWMAAGYDTAES